MIDLLRVKLRTFALAALPACAVLTGCMGTPKAVGIQKVDSLVTRVEKLHYDAELAIESANKSVDALRAIVRHDFDGTAVDAYARFIEALDASELQARRLRGDVGPMDRAAADVYERWTEDLESFSSPSMRYRSQVRRDQTALRYGELVQTLSPSIAAIEGFNGALRDHALFLSNDLNTSSVEILEPELEQLRTNLVLLEDILGTTIAAARAYVEASAPLGQVEVVDEQDGVQTQAESRPERRRR